MLRALIVIRSLLKRLGSVFRRRRREMARLKRAANQEISYLSEQFERLLAEQEVIKEVLLKEIERLNCEQVQAKLELKRENEGCATAEYYLQAKALQLAGSLAALSEEIERSKELQHTLDMVNQLQPMPSQLQKGSCCSKCKHMETLHTQPPVIAPQCHQEPPSVKAPYTQLPSPLPQSFQQTNERVPHKLQARPIPQRFQESSEGTQRTLLPSPLPCHFQEPKVEAPSILPNMTLPQHYQGPTLSHNQYTLWDDLPDFPMTVADLFQPKKSTKKSPTAVAEQPVNQIRPLHPNVPAPKGAPKVLPKYAETPIDGIYLML